MSQFDQDSILFLRCPEKDSCIPISNVFSIFENFNLVPTEHILDKVSFKDLLLITNRSDHVVLMYCDHLESKLETILQCLKNSKTVIAGNFKETSIENTDEFKNFPVTDVDSLASYVHANFNYEGVSHRRQKKQKSTENNESNEIEQHTEKSIVDVCKPPNTNELTEPDVVSVDDDQDKNDCLLYIPEECSLNSDIITDGISDEVRPIPDLDCRMESTSYVNTDSYQVCVMRCFLLDRCTLASNLHSTLEHHDLTTTDFVVEADALNLEVPKIVEQSDFIILVICKHLQQNIRKIKRYLQDVNNKVIISGDLHGLQTKQIFHGFKLFKISDDKLITSSVKTTLSAKRERNEELFYKRHSSDYDDLNSIDGTFKKQTLRHFKYSHCGFVHSSTLEPGENNRGTFLLAKACFPSVLVRSDSLDNLKRRFYIVGEEEKKELIKQIQNVTLKSLRMSSDYLGLITLLGIADYNIQENIIVTLNHLQLEDNIMNRCLRANDLFTAAKWLLGIVKANFGDSHIMVNLLPVVLETISMLYLSTLTITMLDEKVKGEIESFCVESDQSLRSLVANHIAGNKDALSGLIHSLLVLLLDFKTRVGISTSLKIGNLKDALMIQENRSRILRDFQNTMCFLEQYACLAFVANQVTKTMDMEIIEFFDQLIRQLLRKARRKQKINDVLFSVLHLVTKTVLLRLGKDIDVDFERTPSQLSWKLAKMLNLFLDNDRIGLSLRKRLLVMIEPLLLSSSQQIIVNIIYLLRKHDVKSDEIRQRFVKTISLKLHPINFKVRIGSVEIGEDFKPEWVDYEGTMADSTIVTMHMLLPTLNALSKGDVEEYILKSKKYETDRHTSALQVLHSLHEDVTHRCIMQLFAFQCRPIPLFYVTEKSRDPDLLTYLLNSRHVENQLQTHRLLELVVDIIEAVLFLHTHKIIHRNLTCSAFSIRHQGKTVFLHDFSLATSQTSDIAEVVGIPVLWSSPESILEDRFDKRTDAWMLGNVLYEVFTRGCHPYTEVYNTPTDQILEYILFSHLKLYKWPCIPNEVHNAVLGLTQTQPSDRSEISAIKTKMELLLNDEKFKVQGSKISVPLNTKQSQELPQLDMNQGNPEIEVPKLIYQLKCIHGGSSNATKISGHTYVNTRLSQRLHSNSLAISPLDLTAQDKPRILKRFGFLDIREPVTLKFLRILPNIDEETYKEVMCLYDSPERHLSQTGQRMQEQNFPFYLKYRTVRGNNLLEFAFTHPFKHRHGIPATSKDDFIHIVVKIAHFISEMHRRHFILGDLCAENLFVSDDTKQVFLPRIGRVLYFEESDGIEDCLLGCMYQDRRRWNPIEVLQHGQYSYESDIYRFAMTVYEFYTALNIHSQDPMADQLNCAPFAYIESDVLLDVLYNGAVPPRPKLCPDWLYGILLKCWDRDRTQRPSALWLKNIISRQMGDPLLDIDHSLFDKQLDTEIADYDTPRPEIPLRTRKLDQPTNEHTFQPSVSDQSDTSKRYDESSGFILSRSSTVYTRSGRRSSSYRCQSDSSTVGQREFSLPQRFPSLKNLTRDSKGSISHTSQNPLIHNLDNNTTPRSQPVFVESERRPLSCKKLSISFLCFTFSRICTFTKTGRLCNKSQSHIQN
ncbi:unnamed protein product [Mytilus coruscus]|uniref:Protein kinase domain-containing protein n=1 Tax=Mytilus coruscus TaxID=42192 RepID=A0A6J8DM07_MYTCO|nr:unnamed protein product [Mytilus coruscus]